MKNKKKQKEKKFKIRSKRSLILYRTLSCIQSQLERIDMRLRDLLYEKKEPEIDFDVFSFVKTEKGYSLDVEFGVNHLHCKSGEIWTLVNMVNSLRKHDKEEGDEREDTKSRIERVFREQEGQL